MMMMTCALAGESSSLLFLQQRIGFHIIIVIISFRTVEKIS